MAYPLVRLFDRIDGSAGLPLIDRSWPLDVTARPCGAVTDSVAGGVAVSAPT